MVRLVDTTLRDGEQMAGIELGLSDKIEIAKRIDSLGVYQIEAGTPAMGGDEKKSIEKMMSLGLKSKISTWNRMNINDIKHSIDCRVDIIHISVPTSDIHIKFKLEKDRNWVKEQMENCIKYTMDKGVEVVVGFEDASRTSYDFLIELCKQVASLGVKRIRYADTLGILHPQKSFTTMKKIREQVPISLGIHVHNDFGMAVANSIAAVKGGAEYVDCTFGGVGERAGNCNYNHFLRAMNETSNNEMYFDLKKSCRTEKEILDIIYAKQKEV